MTNTYLTPGTQPTIGKSYHVGLICDDAEGGTGKAIPAAAYRTSAALTGMQWARQLTLYYKASATGVSVFTAYIHRKIGTVYADSALANPVVSSTTAYMTAVYNTGVMSDGSMIMIKNITAGNLDLSLYAVINTF